MTTETILLFIVGLLAGAMAVFFIFNAKIKGKTEELRTLSSSLASKETENKMLHDKIEEEKQRRIEEHDEMTAQIRQKEEEWEQERQTMIDYYENERTQAFERHTAQMREQMELIEEKMSNTTQELLKQRSEELGESNNKQMNTIVAPLRESLEAMRKAITESDIKTAENNSALREQIKHLLESTHNIGEEADKLSRALRSNTKVQGNFGEMILTQLLQRFGFREGVEYDVQKVIRTADGQAAQNEHTKGKMITDAVIHFPDDKDVIIDSKVSLTAFTDYINAQTEEEKTRFLSEHIKSVKAHVKELAQKDYSTYLNETRQSLDFVIMFVPVESALVLALSNEPNLWREAFDKKVFITGEQNLFAVLKMVQMSWRQKQQSDNEKKVFRLAETFIDRVGDFSERFNIIGQKLEDAEQAFKKAKDKLETGRQSLIKPAQEMVRLGAKISPNHPLQLPSEDDSE